MTKHKYLSRKLVVGVSVVRRSTLLLRLIVVLFPLASGSFLFYLGADKLNQAYIPEEQWTAPNGVLVFSSVQAQVSWAHLGLQSISVKNSTAGEAWLDYDLVLQPGYAPGEHIGGFQVPYSVESGDFTVTINSGQGDNQATILEQGAISIEEPAKATIVYGRFLIPAGTVSCHLFLCFTWEGLFAREGFSSYSLMIPFANANETIHSKVYECCPNAVALFDDVHFMVEIGIPNDCEFKGSFPAPDTQEIATGKPQGNLIWYYNNTATRWPMPSSNQFRVDFEVPSDAELRNRLFFDSGLYMGLGISLVFSGVYEGLKSVEELMRKRGETRGQATETKVAS
jgi:hypothetical protein